MAIKKLRPRVDWDPFRPAPQPAGNPNFQAPIGGWIQQVPVPLDDPNPFGIEDVQRQLNAYVDRVFEYPAIHPQAHFQIHEDEDLENPGDPGPCPEFLIRPEGLSLDETMVLSAWKKDRQRYLVDLSKQPEPLRDDYHREENWKRVYNDWLLAGGQVRPPQRISDPGMIKRLKARGEATPRFSLPYTPEEMRLRLRGTIVTIDDRPCYVSEAGGNVRDSEHNVVAPGLYVMYSDTTVSCLVPRLHVLDFRPFEPGYIQRHPEFAEFYLRHPARIYRQGIHPENSQMLDAVTGYSKPIPSRSGEICKLLKAFEDRNETSNLTKETIARLTEIYKQTSGTLCPSARLSNKVAATIKDKTQKIHVLFKGVSCCVFDSERNPRFDENFCSLPSVREELWSVGIK